MVLRHWLERPHEKYALCGVICILVRNISSYLASKYLYLLLITTLLALYKTIS